VCWDKMSIGCPSVGTSAGLIFFLRRLLALYSSEERLQVDFLSYYDNLK
jgi:hypothetical protein